jgi:hypothetical protein
MARRMDRLFKLQFLGPFALFAATLCAELAARALQYAPSSELLWFINLRMFGIFQRSYAMLSELVIMQGSSGWSEVTSIPGFQLFGLALPIFLLACYGLVARRRLPLALASNLSFMYAAFLLLSWQLPGSSSTQASLGFFAVPTGAGFYVLTGILGTCLLSFSISHLLYLRAARSEI